MSNSVFLSDFLISCLFLIFKLGPLYFFLWPRAFVGSPPLYLVVLVGLFIMPDPYRLFVFSHPSDLCPFWTPCCIGLIGTTSYYFELADLPAPILSPSLCLPRNQPVPLLLRLPHLVLLRWSSLSALRAKSRPLFVSLYVTTLFTIWYIQEVVTKGCSWRRGWR